MGVMTGAKKLISGVLTQVASAAAAIVYFLDDEFTTAAVAPLATPRTAEPGPGTAVTQDANTKGSYSGGKFTVVATSTNHQPAIVYDTPSIARVCGNAIFAPVNVSAGRMDFGYCTSSIVANIGTTRLGAFNISAASLGIDDEGGFPTIATLVAGTDYKVCVVQRNTGWFYFIKGGAFTTWTLVWVGTSGTTPTSFAFLTTLVGCAATADYIHGRLLPAPFNLDYNIATVTNTSLASGNTFTGTADAINDFEFTLNGSPSAGDVVALYYRGDDVNGWLAKAVRNVGNTAWDLQVRTVASSVESTPAGWTDVTGVGSIVQIRAIANGTTNRFFTRTGTTWTKRGATLTVSNQDSATGMKITAAAGTTLTRVTSWPWMSSQYTELDNGNP